MPCYGRSLARDKMSIGECVREEAEQQSHGDDVRMRVVNALHWDFAVPRDRLKVDVEDGRVTLSCLTPIEIDLVIDRVGDVDFEGPRRSGERQYP
jgi:hypothetical protein